MSARNVNKVHNHQKQKTHRRRLFVQDEFFIHWGIKTSDELLLVGILV
jgi:hypothetical protein